MRMNVFYMWLVISGKGKREKGKCNALQSAEGKSKLPSTFTTDTLSHTGVEKLALY